MYQALYRKYRPLFFTDVAGQTAIVKILKNSILNQQVGHAYMFFGPRGTGKTSLAKIFARTINCEHLENGEICQQCNSCLEMLEKNCVDIIEIDAASNNGVEEIRELKSKVSLVPSQLKYKVYIIDEVHMLTPEAFNALLKTLEEPPEHIVFILATTDPQKVPETIKSRCQCFNFKRLSEFEIVEKLKYIVENENIQIDEQVLNEIALSANGGLRDSISSLDMLYSSCGKKITLSDYINLCDFVDKKEIVDLMDQVLYGKIDDCLEHIEVLYNSGKNLVQIWESLLLLGRDYVVDYYKNKKKIEPSIDLVEEFIFLLNEKMVDLKKSSHPKIYMEIIFLKFMSRDHDSKKIKQTFDKNDRTLSNIIVNKNNEDIESFDNGNVTKNDSLKNEIVSTSSVDKSLSENLDNTNSYDKIDDVYLKKYHEVMKVRIDNTLAHADKKLLVDAKQKLLVLKDFVFDQQIGYLVCSLMDGNVRVVSQENILFSLEYESMIDSNLKNMELLKDTLKKITGLEQNIAFITEENWKIKKNEYIQKIKVGDNYNFVNEPDIPVVEEKIEKDNFVHQAVALFGDIVEEE